MVPLTSDPAGPDKDAYAARLGQRLTMLRSAAGLTDVEVADRAGLDLQSYRILETGRPGGLQLLTGDAIGRLAAALDTSPAHLLAAHPRPS